jgi:hypothetical protein
MQSFGCANLFSKSLSNLFLHLCNHFIKPGVLPKNTINMTTLTKVLFATVVAFATLTFSAKADTQDRHLSGFNGVSVSGSFDVYLTQGTTESVKVDAPKDVIDRIMTDVQGGVLNIYNKRGFNWHDFTFGNKKMVVYVTVKDINRIGISGSGDVYFKEGISTNALRIHVSGSGDVIGKLNVKTLETGISGSGDVKLMGRADNSSASVSGSGDFSARDLVTISSAIHVAGSGNATVNASDRIDASVSGSGDIRYTGAAKHVSSSKSGSGDIHRM